MKGRNRGGREGGDEGAMMLARARACVCVCVRKRMEHGSPAAPTSMARRVGEEGLAEPN